MCFSAHLAFTHTAQIYGPGVAQTTFQTVSLGTSVNKGKEQPSHEASGSS